MLIVSKLKVTILYVVLGPDPKICCQFDFKRLAGYGLTCPWRIPPQPITDENVARK